MDEFCFDDYWEVSALGRSGRIILLWHTNFVSVTHKRQTLQELHVMIKVLSNNLPLYFHIINEITYYGNQIIMWKNLIYFTRSITGPWLVVGDFNEFLTQNDK